MVSHSEIFHQVVINGRRYVGVIGGGDPYITRLDDNPLSQSGQLGGVCSIVRMTKPPPHDARSFPGPGYYLCKYNNQIKLPLLELDHAGAAALAAAFGLPMGLPAPSDGNFWGSPAGPAFAAWCVNHPKIGKQVLESAEYIPGWGKRRQRVRYSDLPPADARSLDTLCYAFCVPDAPATVSNPADLGTMEQQDGEPGWLLFPAHYHDQQPAITSLPNASVVRLERLGFLARIEYEEGDDMVLTLAGVRAWQQRFQP